MPPLPILLIFSMFQTMCCKPHQCFISLETVTSSGQIFLPDSQRIRDGHITSIQLPRSGSLTLKTQTGKTVAADTVIATAHLLLYNQIGNLLAQIPLIQLQRDYNAPEPLRVDWSNVDPTQTSILLSTTAAGYAADAAIEIIFGLDCDACGVKLN